MVSKIAIIMIKLLAFFGKDSSFLIINENKTIRISPRDLIRKTGNKKIIQEKPGLNIGGYMVLLMAKHRGKVDGKKIMELLRKYVK